MKIHENNDNETMKYVILQIIKAIKERIEIHKQEYDEVFTYKLKTRFRDIKRLNKQKDEFLEMLNDFDIKFDLNKIEESDEKKENNKIEVC